MRSGRTWWGKRDWVLIESLPESMVRTEEVQHREQEDPHEIDEVPVQAGDLHPGVALGPEVPLDRLHEHPGHDAQADDHVERVQTGHREVEREEDARLRTPLAELRRVEARPGHQVVVPLLPGLA